MRRAALPTVLIGLIALAAGCGGSPVAAPGSADLSNGKSLFQQRCGACHTLSDAGPQGTIGPNLDDAYVQPRLNGFRDTSFEAMVKDQIAEAEPPMPRNLVTGQDAVDVAAYVAAVAGVQEAKKLEASGVKPPG
jgi:mono/diheme cytochrome c family protein